ncbi:hypothetical protein SERLA73DRAFT_181535 [Serpula lacrymans var. lacrymans S7.3]|uniref:COQ9 C-terminal domain-containing protein n=2 Tax=Serpula lacrymans var. lacrymans TaxID=341189 RepID=F8PY85_SERL3|nr:uncharacterized protein SERLADRAFT_467735 [Serpula lacrymans var. lacrymans S7.9]EGN98848.1 hypothetical protein SERLA73DRAFT_181535 [Serpula lacrymans var. lacrymans S7.3]EGO24436.1 hypothetical protein SERLADRAFT_467735 [Serpula lacrymans var. lacrymans S7.9]
MATTSARLLQLAIPLVKTHGFTREALSRSVLSLPTPHAQPLPDAAITSLFGQGDNARKSLIDTWLEDAREQMKATQSTVVKDVLWARLQHNEPVLNYLPDAFAVLASSSTFLPLDPEPAITHAAKVANEACWIAYPTEKSWHTRRASIAAIYLASELHQLTSPSTTYQFLSSLIETSSAAETSLTEAQIFGSYVFKSWAGIVKSTGVFL